MKSVAAIIFSLLAFACPSLQEPPECEHPFSAVGEMCLFIDALSEGTWYDMRLFCSMQTEGATLVKIKTADQLHQIVQEIEETGLNQHHYWIAATDIDHEDIWVYPDGSEAPREAPFWRYDCDGDFTQRPLYNTTANCAALDMEVHFLMADFDCLGDGGYIAFSPICEAPPVPTTTTSTTTVTTETTYPTTETATATYPTTTT